MNPPTSRGSELPPCRRAWTWPAGVDLAGVVVTADALHTQADTAAHLVDGLHAHDASTVERDQKTALPRHRSGATRPASIRDTSGAVRSHGPWSSQRPESTVIRVIPLSFHACGDGKRSRGGRAAGLVPGLSASAGSGDRAVHHVAVAQQPARWMPLVSPLSFQGDPKTANSARAASTVRKSADFTEMSFRSRCHESGL
jgi:hypothetical protein